MLKGIVVVVGSLLHIHLNCVKWGGGGWWVLLQIHLNCVQGVGGSCRGSTPYLSPSELCSIGLLMLNGVVMVVGPTTYPSELCSWCSCGCGGSTPYPSDLCSRGSGG